ncbi:hypothetical protein PV336_38555 [Streptomyces sp. MI02-2A]|nr:MULTISPECIES: hypothetical protein [unclassified Streptomyces]MDX3265024.1 hypothetical protein [Streptomyces sp. MI02-2A]REE57688.1 hypothetical protein BX257_0051 [Streptomyces sp. 3212.3]
MTGTCAYSARATFVYGTFTGGTSGTAAAFVGTDLLPGRKGCYLMS